MEIESFFGYILLRKEGDKMLIVITPEIHRKLEEIGFEKDEIDAISFIHELKIGKYSDNISELVKKRLSLNVRKQISDRIKELRVCKKTNRSMKIFGCNLKLIRRLRIDQVISLQALSCCEQSASTNRSIKNCPNCFA